MGGVHRGQCRARQFAPLGRRRPLKHRVAHQRVAKLHPIHLQLAVCLHQARPAQARRAADTSRPDSPVLAESSVVSKLRPSTAAAASTTGAASVSAATLSSTRSTKLAGKWGRTHSSASQSSPCGRRAPDAIRPPSSSSRNSGSPSALVVRARKLNLAPHPPTEPQPALALRPPQAVPARATAPPPASQAPAKRPGAPTAHHRAASPPAASARCSRSLVDTQPAPATRDPPSAGPPTRARRRANPRAAGAAATPPRQGRRAPAPYRSSARTIQATCAQARARSSAGSFQAPLAHAAPPPAPRHCAERRLPGSRCRPPTQHEHPCAACP
jgi:hypothetical protein